MCAERGATQRSVNNWRVRLPVRQKEPRGRLLCGENEVRVVVVRVVKKPLLDRLCSKKRWLEEEDATLRPQERFGSVCEKKTRLHGERPTVL